MEFWRICVKLFDGRELECVSERVNVREFMEYWLNKVSCGVVWVKRGVNCVEDLSDWRFEEIDFCCYRKGYSNKLVWENWREKREIRERERLIDFGE